MKKVLVLVALAALLIYPASALALQLNFDTAFSGTVNPSGPAPWATAIFSGTGTVELRIDSKLTSLTSGQFISEISFNVDPNLDLSKLDIKVLTNPSPADDPKISIGLNQFKADGDGYFDILIEFSTGGDYTNRFDDSDYMIFSITTTQDGLTDQSFKFPSAPGGGAGSWEGAAHIQGIAIPGGGETSAWVGPGPGIFVPEPGTMLLLGLGLIAVGVAVRNRS